MEILIEIIKTVDGLSTEQLVTIVSLSGLALAAFVVQKGKGQ